MKFQRQIDLPYPQPWEYVAQIVERTLGHQKNGFFVDVGAYDGILVTNTHFFEDTLNWNGICIEPNPRAYNDLIKNRKSTCFNFGVSDEESNLEFVKVNGYAEMLSGFKQFLSQDHLQRIQDEITKHNDSVETVIIPSRRLDNIFRENNVSEIDYLSIDTEGNELRVLKSIDFERCYIKIISAENNDNSSETRSYLESKNYKFLNKICGDDIYINNSLINN